MGGSIVGGFEQIDSLSTTAYNQSVVPAASSLRRCFLNGGGP